MVKIYVRKIKEGKITLEDVPQRWRNEVQAMLIKEGD